MNGGAFIKSALQDFLRDERGTTLTEFAIVLGLFLLIFFGLIDFGRWAFHWVAAERALTVAARIAAVRPPACTGVPDTNVRPSTTTTPPPRFGTSCSVASTCASVAPVSCTGTLSNPTVAEIYSYIAPALPTGNTEANLRFTYSYDANLGFLGGPYVPIVTVDLQDAPNGGPKAEFFFFSPLAALVSFAGGAAPTGLGSSLPMTSISVSLPAEDLNLGTAG